MTNPTPANWLPASLGERSSTLRCFSLNITNEYRDIIAIKVLEQLSDFLSNILA